MKKSKFEIRKHFRAIRQAVSTEQKHLAAQAAARIFRQESLFAISQLFACYLPVKDEFDSLPLIEAIWYEKKQCYLPVLTKDEKTLFFVLYEYGDRLHLNKYNILEPVNITRKMPAESLEVVITPLIAFDGQGHRLGTGGGYYDRTFEFIHENPEKKPFMLGLGYASQEIKALPADPWDIQLEGVITEKKFIFFSSN